MPVRLPYQATASFLGEHVFLCCLLLHIVLGGHISTINEDTRKLLRFLHDGQTRSQMAKKQRFPGKTTKALTNPAPGTVVAPTYRYTDQQIVYIQLLREYAYLQLLPKSDSYYQWELQWLNRPDTPGRYLRASRWDLDEAKRRLKATMDWRRDFKPDLIPPDEVKIESETGKIMLNGFDNDGRPILYLRPGRENTETSNRQLRHLVWWLERAKDLMPPGQESLAIIVDYKSCSLRTNPSISIARKVLNILQLHYVELLGRALVVNLPTILAFFYKAISPFLDPVTRDKILFNPDLKALIPLSQLDAELGGEFNFEFEPNSYWNQFVSTCGIAPDGTRVKNLREKEDMSRLVTLTAAPVTSSAVGAILVL